MSFDIDRSALVTPAKLKRDDRERDSARLVLLPPLEWVRRSGRWVKGDMSRDERRELDSPSAWGRRWLLRSEGEDSPDVGLNSFESECRLRTEEGWEVDADTTGGSWRRMLVDGRGEAGADGSADDTRVGDTTFSITVDISYWLKVWGGDGLAVSVWVGVVAREGSSSSVLLRPSPDELVVL